MKTQPLVLMGLALVGATGCQSYFPNNYAASPAYFPPEAYTSTPTRMPANPTYQSSPTNPSSRGTPPAGQMNAGSMNKEAPLRNTGAPTAGTGQKPVPEPKVPVTTPQNLGAQNDDDEQTLRPQPGRKSPNPRPLESWPDDVKDNSSQTDSEQFVFPASAESFDDPGLRRLPRPAPGLFRVGENHSSLRGLIVRDPQGKGWRLKYSDDPADGDPYGGVLPLVGHKRLEELQENDTILVEGAVDESVTNRYGKPTYRVKVLDWVKPRDKK